MYFLPKCVYGVQLLKLGWVILMMDNSGDAALIVVPNLVQYDNNDDFVSLYCTESDYTEIPVDWLDPNGNVMTKTTEASRICGKLFECCF